MKKFKSYNDRLEHQFRKLPINLVKHDCSPCGLPCYIEASLGSTPKDKGELVLDLGNYIHRFLGLSYQMTPEFRGRGKQTTLRWFMSWQDVSRVQKDICEALGRKVLASDWLPVEFDSLIIQDVSKGVKPPTAKELDNES